MMKSRSQFGWTSFSLMRPASSGSFPSAPSPARPISRERIAFWRASLNVLPMAIASPTDFICVPRTGGVDGNFSKAQRGIFTTT